MTQLPLVLLFESMSGNRGTALRPVARLKLYEDLVERLADHAREARLKPGDRFPPERELAARLGVSRASVRQAMVVLEVQRQVEVRHGDGVYLIRELRAVDSLPRLIERRRRLPEILEAREAMETKLAELAALRRTETGLAALEAALEEMQSEVATGGIGAEGDAHFHRAIALAAHSAVLVALMEMIDDPVRETRMESLSQPGRPEESLEAHRRILAAIRDGKGPAAAEAMRAHLKVVADVKLLRWQPPLDGRNGGRTRQISPRAGVRKSR